MLNPVLNRWAGVVTPLAIGFAIFASNPMPTSAEEEEGPSGSAAPASLLDTPDLSVALMALDGVVLLKLRLLVDAADPECEAEAAFVLGAFAAVVAAEGAVWYAVSTGNVWAVAIAVAAYDAAALTLLGSYIALENCLALH